jgi:hypothetical protein
VLDRLSPNSMSGGSIGPDGLLYVTGNERPELYVLARPTQGARLVHVATVSLGIAGRAIAWDRFEDDRILWTVRADGGEIRTYRVPRIVPPVGLPRFDPARMD